MNDTDFIKLIEKAKMDDRALEFLLEKYSPLLKKYSTINGYFYEDLYSNILVVTIKLIKNSNFHLNSIKTNL